MIKLILLYLFYHFFYKFKGRCYVYLQVKVSHILVKHKDSRKPSSWRQDKITRTKDEALDIIKSKIKIERDIFLTCNRYTQFLYCLGYREDITKGKRTFDEIAKQFSDCSSARANGDLGFFCRGKMQKPFEDASFALKIDELSQPVFTDSGVHLIIRTG